MPKSDLAKKLDEVIKVVAPILKMAGYKKRGNTFNKCVEPGIIHVVNFQMAPYMFNNVNEILPFRHNLYGSFTINLGVFILEVHNAVHGWKVSDFVSEPECEIRMRIGKLLSDGTDLWWDLSGDTSTISSDVIKLIQDVALPFLEKLSSRNLIIDEWEKHGDSIGLPPRGRLSIAIMLYGQGKIDEAKELMLAEDIENRNKPSSGLVSRVAERIGINLY
jgi:hypothetical protein